MGSSVTLGQFAELGVPKILNILMSWSVSDTPGKRGLPFTISANMHPTLQMSIGVEYFFDPIKMSGALYHRVTTSWVYFRTGIPNALDGEAVNPGRNGTYLSWRIEVGTWAYNTSTKWHRCLYVGEGDKPIWVGSTWRVRNLRFLILLPDLWANSAASSRGAAPCVHDSRLFHWATGVEMIWPLLTRVLLRVKLDHR